MEQSREHPTHTTAERLMSLVTEVIAERVLDFETSVGRRPVTVRVYKPVPCEHEQWASKVEIIGLPRTTNRLKPPGNRRISNRQGAKNAPRTPRRDKNFGVLGVLGALAVHFSVDQRDRCSRAVLWQVWYDPRRLPSSVLRPPSSVLRPPSSVFRLRQRARARYTPEVAHAHAHGRRTRKTEDGRRAPNPPEHRSRSRARRRSARCAARRARGTRLPCSASRPGPRGSPPSGCAAPSPAPARAA
jgi:hypothetical protein